MGEETPASWRKKNLGSVRGLTLSWRGRCYFTCVEMRQPRYFHDRGHHRIFQAAHGLPADWNDYRIVVFRHLPPPNPRLSSSTTPGISPCLPIARKVRVSP